MNANLTFDTLPLSRDLIEVTRELGYQTMTPIQAESIPLLLEGKDLIGQSKTGSGKTAAFALPILNRITPRQIQLKQVQALILCPTRELCTQVAREIRKIGRKHSGLQVLIVSGGHPIYPQLCALEKGVHIVVGTPGRVLDLLSRQKLNLSMVNTVVLDESDRMLDMGFQDEMEQILKEVPKPRQMVFFSATFPRSIESMSRAYQTNATRITIESTDGPASPDIQQLLFETDDSEFSTSQATDKLTTLIGIFKTQQPESAIVFCNLKATVTDLTRRLTLAGISAACIHGDLEQADRDRVMAKFRNHSTRILVATDVAARGIDVENLDIVVNFDFPAKADVYVHRIGRTGRAGKKGLAISFASTHENIKVRAIEKFMGIKLERASSASLIASLVASGGSTSIQQLDVPTTRDADQAVSPITHSGIIAEAKMDTLFIAGGRKDKLRPGDILGALTGEAGQMKAGDVGKIEIHDRFAYVAISKSLSEAALQSLRDGRIKGRKFRVERVK